MVDTGILGEKKFWTIIALVSIMGALLSATIPGTRVDLLLPILSVTVLARFVKTLLSRRFSVDLLMGTAGLATWFMWSFFEGFLVFMLYSISELLEQYAEEYAERKLTGLTRLLPDKIRVRINDDVAEKPVDQVSPGDVVVVRPGETVPVDGILVSSEGLFDTSMVTGELVPRRLSGGERVESSYTCIGELVLVKALKKPSESLLQLLVREAERALGEKSRIQRLVERVSKPYTLIVLSVFAIALLRVPPYNALAILLAGCPSAFIIASSVATTLSIVLLARIGVIARGGIVLENTAKTSIVVLDKTGTLTFGELEVVEVKPYNGFTEKQLLELAGAAAKASIHPVSRSLARYSGLSPVSAKEYPGQGVEAVVDGRRILLGSKSFLEERSLSIPVSRCKGYRSVYVGVGDVFAGEICLREKVGEDTVETVEYLLENGYRVVIASGDDVERVREIAGLLGVKEYYGGMSPGDKNRLIEELRRNGKVMMIGDGVNDLEALAKADVGVAIGRIDVVSSIADIVLDKVSKTSRVIGVSKKYIKSIATAIALAATVKTAVMVLGLIGALPLWAIVGLGDDGATLLVLSATIFPNLRHT